MGAVDAQIVELRGKDIGFCTHCDYCVRKKRGCVQKDDMQEIYPVMLDADAWVLATPVYQGSVSGQLKALMDRCRALVAKDPDALADKVGAAIAVGGDRIGGQEPAIMTIHSFYMANKMIPVSGGPFGSNLGGTVWSRDKGAEGTKGDRTGKRSIERTVERLVEVARKMKGAVS
jgi:multimeric flavodoxin WrbA